MITNPEQPARPSKWSAILVVACILPLYFLFVHLGDPGRGLAAAISGIGSIGAVLAFRNRWSTFWFWSVVTGLILLHVTAILILPWPKVDYSGPVLAGPALMDFFLCYGCMKLAEKRLNKSREG